jgi:PAS domain-containing protein
VLVNQLEEELRATRDDLQSTIERLEASNEDLNTSNEEVVSVNEELRSLNEELESSKEELQSLNEELNTVNQQLEAKLRELETSNDDLRNVLVSSAVATLCLDPELRIKWFAPATRKLFNLLESDIGRPIRDFSPALCDPGLIEAAGHVLAGSPAAQHEFHTEQGQWYIRHILPYKVARPDRERRDHQLHRHHRHPSVARGDEPGAQGPGGNSTRQNCGSAPTRCARCRPRWPWPRNASAARWRRICTMTSAR